MKLYNGDCLEVLKTFEDNTIDSIVTDPPYGISFMGKKWDYDIPSVEIWQEVLRVLKPGGHALVACGTRTQHRMAVNLEDAGFEIRDIVAWVYGCLSEDTEILTEKGFRHLHKTKQNDRIAVYDIQTNTYKWEKPKKWQTYNIKQDTAYRIQSDYTDQIVSRNHRCLVEREGKLVFIQAEELAGMETMPYLSNDFYNLQEASGTGYKTTLATITPIEYTGMIFCPTVSTGVFVARRNGKVFITGNSGFPKSLNVGKAIEGKLTIGSSNVKDIKKLQGIKREVTCGFNKTGKDTGYRDKEYVMTQTEVEYQTEEGKEYQGWGTALKPAMELWTLCRKPLKEKTVAQNVLKYGTGGINIDGCRVGTETTRTTIKDLSQAHGNQFGKAGITYPTQGYKENPPGRFPANLIHDGSDEVVGLFPENASRFFYCAKASKSERNNGLEGFEEQVTDDGRNKPIDNAFQRGKTLRNNNHPTVKPIKLMQYLCRLITPKKGIVLDCFMGSGTTGIGAKLEGFDFIGIEKDKQYFNIAEARIKATTQQLSLEEL